MSTGGFFEFREKVTRGSAKSSARSTGTSAGSPAGSAMTVTALTTKIDGILKAGFPTPVLVKGEVSNLRPNAASGHYYFTLKDATSCVPCVMWKSDVAALKFQPRDGMELLANGKVSVFAQQGKYQLYVSSLQPLGQGSLEVAFQQLKAKLEAEGLFEAAQKPIPAYPRRVALVTSRATAALQDMLKVLRRYPWIELFVYHAPVQGNGAAEKLAAAVAHLDASRETFAIDVILLARGGGSLEDLWEFNEECVARAIAASSIPVVTGIGHEVDTSIADLVADHHAHTPTEAAQTIVAEWNNAAETLDAGATRLRRGVRGVLSDARKQLAGIERHETFRRPFDRVNQLRQLLDDRQRALLLGVGEKLRWHQRQVGELARRMDRHRPEMLVGRFRQRLQALERGLARHTLGRVKSLSVRLERVVALLADCHPKHQLKLESGRVNALEAGFRRAMAADLKQRGAKLAGMAAQLQALSPENVLRRGYSMTTLKKSGAVVRHPDQLKAGDRLLTRLAEGTIESTVEDAKQLPLFE